MIRIGTRIDGRRVVRFACGCGHEKTSHNDREILGRKVKVDGKYEIPITIEENMGKCTEEGCWCWRFDPTSPVLEDDTILGPFGYFRCEECRKYYIKSDRFQRGDSICIHCANIFYPKKLKALNQFIQKVNDLKGLMGTKYPAILERYISIESEDYECPSTGTDMKQILEKMLQDLKSEKERLEEIVQKWVK